MSKLEFTPIDDQQPLHELRSFRSGREALIGQILGASTSRPVARTDDAIRRFAQALYLAIESESSFKDATSILQEPNQINLKEAVFLRSAHLWNLVRRFASLTENRIECVSPDANTEPLSKATISLAIPWIGAATPPAIRERIRASWRPMAELVMPEKPIEQILRMPAPGDHTLSFEAVVEFAYNLQRELEESLGRHRTREAMWNTRLVSPELIGEVRKLGIGAYFERYLRLSASQPGMLGVFEETRTLQAGAKRCPTRPVVAAEQTLVMPPVDPIQPKVLDPQPPLVVDAIPEPKPPVVQAEKAAQPPAEVSQSAPPAIAKPKKVRVVSKPRTQVAATQVTPPEKRAEVSKEPVKMKAKGSMRVDTPRVGLPKQITPAALHELVSRVLGSAPSAARPNRIHDAAAVLEVRKAFWDVFRRDTRSKMDPETFWDAANDKTVAEFLNRHHLRHPYLRLSQCALNDAGDLVESLVGKIVKRFESSAAAAAFLEQRDPQVILDQLYNGNSAGWAAVCFYDSNTRTVREVQGTIAASPVVNVANMLIKVINVQDEYAAEIRFPDLVKVVPFVERAYPKPKALKRKSSASSKKDSE